MIFRRKRPEEGGGLEIGGEPSAPAEAPGSSGKPFTRIPPAEGGPRPLAGITRPAGAAAARPGAGEAPRRPPEIPTAPRKGERPAMPASEGKKLIVGRDIVLNGQ